MEFRLFRPSSAARWIQCPGSQLMELNIDNPTNEAAEIGTTAHLMADFYVKNGGDFGEILPDSMSERKGYIDNDMIQHVQEYVSYIQSLKQQGYLILTELTLDMSNKLGFKCTGTADCIAYNVKTKSIKVIDLKYGFVDVSVENNPQLMLYLIGALDYLSLESDFEEMELVIYQPRSFSNTLKTFYVEPETLEIFTWEVKYAYSHFLQIAPDNITRSLFPSEEACKYCLARSVCPALRSTVLSCVQGDIVNLEALDPEINKRLELIKTLPNDDIQKIIENLPLISIFIKAIEAFAYSKLSNGETIEGLKLVKGREGNRKWANEDVAIEYLKDILNMDGLYKKSLVSPSDVERLVKGTPVSKQVKNGIERLTTRAPAVPVLALESDKREAFLSENLLDYFD